MMTRKRGNVEINSSSMADIAFLLLIFFLVTTTIVNDKGVMLLLPPKKTEENIAPIHERNLFKIQVNSEDQLLVNGELTDDIQTVRADIQTFVLNYGKDESSSESPKKAIVSIKTNRGTTYEKYIEVLNAVQGAYYDIYAKNANITNASYRSLDLSKPADKLLATKAKKGIPMNISIAEPSN
jgi:biopolymer transport protein ExbD